MKAKTRMCIIVTYTWVPYGHARICPVHFCEIIASSFINQHIKTKLLKQYFFYHFYNICRSVSSYFVQMPHFIVTPIRFNIFAEYGTLVYHDFNTSNKNIIMSSFKSSRDIQKKEGGPDMFPLLAHRAKRNYNCAILHI